MSEVASTRDYENLASFYLGKKYQLDEQLLLKDKLLYDSKDLTTHALCVGMTGSGKTGLCLSLLEEAALDGIPAICIDPKGDLGNLLLAFPGLTPREFAPWVDPAEAARQGIEREQLAAQTAARWRAGLDEWDQDAARIQSYLDAVDMAIYTPGSTVGLPMTVLRSFDAPPQAVIDDAEMFGERIAGAASGLLTLMGIDADPLTSREHILLANIFDHAWRRGHSLDLPSLIRFIQSPPMERIGVFDLESYYPAPERMKLAMTLNNLLASPSFAGWLQGEPLNIQKLLYTAAGKPRLTIISIAHLSDSERMFFVTILLNELLSWMRTQPGTGSLRALFYMDEVFGYFPPVANPPSKPPMLMLLKQARAFGLGIVLATQNPVDLDYKGLANIGTWFLGRLQTQRDKDRVLAGLEGAATHGGTPFDRAAMERTLAALGSRVFLMYNVHDDGPTVFQTRWAMSFLRGPLSRPQIQMLMDPRRTQTPTVDAQGASNAPSGAAPVVEVPAAASRAAGRRPVVPNDVVERFAMASQLAQPEAELRYRPALLASVSCHYVRVSAGVDVWLDHALIVMEVGKLSDDPWSDALRVSPDQLELSQEPEQGFAFDELPSPLLNDKQYRRWGNALKDYLYRHLPVTVFACRELKAFSQPGQSELDARLGWQQAVREQRDAKKQELREKYAAKLKSLESKIRTAEQRVAREQAQYDQEKWKTALNLGQTLLGAFLGNKISSRSATTGRGIGRAAQQRTDVVLASETLEDLLRDQHELEQACEREIHELQHEFRVDQLTLEPLDIACRKGDIQVNLLALLWLPGAVDANGQTSYLVDLPTRSANAAAS